MTATQTRTKSGKGKRILKRLQDTTKDAESTGDARKDNHDDHDDPEYYDDDTEHDDHASQIEHDDDEPPGKTVTMELREDPQVLREAGQEPETPMLSTTDDGQRAEQEQQEQQQLESDTRPRRRTIAQCERDEQDAGAAAQASQRRVTIVETPQVALAVPTAATQGTTSTATSRRTTRAESTSVTHVAAGSELSEMAAAIRDLTSMVSNLHSTEAHDSHRDRHSRRRTTRRRARTRTSTQDSASSSSSSDERRHRYTRNRRGAKQRHSGDDDGGGDSSSSSGSDESSSPSSDESSSPSSDESSSSSSSQSENNRRGRHGRQEHHGRRERHGKQRGRRSVKDLELPTFSPSPRMSVSTWIDRVDLALKGAEKSGRGKWSDHALYFILGNKLLEDAATWWVNQDRRLKKRQRTWTNLKKALLRRYGPKLDKSNAELRVTMRRLMPGETYADFASGLRAIVGRNRVKERVLLAQFLRCLDKTTKKLVQQKPKPRTLEEAVDKATEIDDPMDNVAQGMANIGQPWAVAPSPHLMTMTGTTGPLNVIPGISGTGLPAEIASAVEANNGEASGVALFTNPQGVWNECSGTWDPLPGHVWNGKFWAETKKREVRRQSTRSKTEGKKSSGKAKTKREELVSSGDESDVKPQRKKFKAAVKQAAVDTKWRGTGRSQGNKRQESGVKGPREPCFKCGKSGHWSSLCSVEPKCFACNQTGHFARECTDADAKARNDAYLAQREQQSKAVAENTDRAQ